MQAQPFHSQQPEKRIRQPVEDLGSQQGSSGVAVGTVPPRTAQSMTVLTPAVPPRQVTRYNTITIGLT